MHPLLPPPCSDHQVNCYPCLLFLLLPLPLLQVEEPDEAIKMFNDVDLVLDVVSCVQLAIKLRAKYFKKVSGGLGSQ